MKGKHIGYKFAEMKDWREAFNFAQKIVYYRVTIPFTRKPLIATYLNYDWVS